MAAPPLNGTPPSIPDPTSDPLFGPIATAASLCGFALPTFQFAIGFALPFPIQIPPALPKFTVSLGFNCKANNPIDVVGDLSWGGGRVSNAAENPDDALAAYYDGGGL